MAPENSRIADEHKVRETRKKKEPCPFLIKDSEGCCCGRVDIRCGERQQFSRLFQPETIQLKGKRHLCLREEHRDKPPRFLVVDDDDETRELCVAYLKLLKIEEYFAAKDGVEAKIFFEKIKRENAPVSVVTSDVQMGNEAQSGYSLSEFVKERNFPSFIILMSADENMLSYNTDNPQITHRLKKPLSFDHFIECVEATLKKAGKTLPPA